jgi:RNA polymerase sigma-70 factor (ECF subfamily)
LAKPEIVELARKAMDGNRRAFDELCEKKSKELLFTALGVLGDMPDAEDAVQETILKMCRSFAKLRSAEAIDVWMYRVLMSRCMVILDKRKKRITELDIDDEAISIEDDDAEFIPEKYAEDKELGKQLYEIILALPLAKREAILMYYYDGLSHKEIADIKGVTEKSISSTIAKARKIIKDGLEKTTNANAAFGMGISTSVLSRVLDQQAKAQISPQMLAAFNAKCSAAAKGVNFSATKTTLSAKIVAGVATVALICGAGYFAASHYNLPEVATVTVITDSGADAGKLTGAMDSIEFINGDCKCGHQNPESADIKGDAAVLAKMLITWDIKSSSGDVISSGAGRDVTSELGKLKEENRNGQYRLSFYLEDDDHNVITMERDFEIGAFAYGDIA